MVYCKLQCKNSCDALLWNCEGDELFVSFYDKDHENQIMKGSIEIYDFSIENMLTLNQTIENNNNGILHITKWEKDKIFVGDTSGTINMLKLQENSIWEMEYDLCETYKNSMCLYMDYQNESKTLWYSCQNGSVTNAKSDGVSKIKNIKTYTSEIGHKFEAWYISAYNEHLAISGGDDGKVFIWDERLDKFVSKIDKFFDYGVTSILPILHNKNQFMVGSFDESISIWDIRKGFKEPIKHFKNLGGQIWRMRWKINSECNKNLFACAMMQSESAIYEMNELNDIKLIYKHNSFAQLVYGVEWHPKINNTIISCSHKDKLLELYSF